MEKDNDIDYISIISKLEFQIQQLQFQIEQLQKKLNYKTDTIKMLEYTLVENRAWEPILNENDKTDETNKQIDENIIYHNIVNHFNKILIKKGMYKHNKLSDKIVRSVKNIKII